MSQSTRMEDERTDRLIEFREIAKDNAVFIVQNHISNALLRNASNRPLINLRKRF